MRTAIVRNVLLGLAGVVLGFASAGAQAPGNGMAPRFAPRRPPFEQALGMQGAEGRWWNKPGMIEKLKLTDDQRKAMDQILYDHRAKLIDLQANLEKAELAMQPLMSAGQPDQKAIEAQIDKVVSARGELERANARFLLDIRMKLTPDQWKQMLDLRANGMRGDAAPGPGRGPNARQQWRSRRNGPGDAPPPPDGAQPPAPGSNPPAAQPQGGGAGAEQ